MVRTLGRKAFLCDTNIWFALLVGAHPHHDRVREWVESVGGDDSLLFCRATQQSLLRLISTAGVMAPYSLPPFTNQEAWSLYEATVSDHRIVLLEDEPDELSPLWRQFSASRFASPKLWMDAYLAAFARAGNYTLVTVDRAFSQFPGLSLEILGATTDA